MHINLINHPWIWDFGLLFPFYFFCRSREKYFCFKKVLTKSFIDYNRKSNFIIGKIVGFLLPVDEKNGLFFY